MEPDAIEPTQIINGRFDMKDLYQKSLKAVLEQADALTAKVAAEKRAPTADEDKQLGDLAVQAQGLAKQIDSANMLEAAKKYGNESAGSVVAASFGRETLDGEGDIPGVTADPHTGEMRAVDGAWKSAGHKKLESLKSGAYKDAFAEYIRSEGLKRTPAIKGDAMKILNEGADTTGGFWLPPDYRPELIKKIAAMSSIRPNASVYTTGADHLTFPAVTYNGSTVDDTYANIFTSGVRFTWRDSAGSTADYSESTNPIAGQINIPVHLATAAIILTREQLEDNSFDLLGYITQLGGEAFALGEEYAYTLGTGAGQPQGFLIHPATNILSSTYLAVGGITYWGNQINTGSTTIVWGAAATYPGTGIIGMEASLPPQYESGAKWFANKFTYAAIRGLNAGTTTVPQWSLGDAYPSYANGMQASLLGYGLVKNQFMGNPATAVKYLALGEMGGYYIVDRVGLSVEVFREVYGLRDQVVVYMRKRTGGQLVHYWKMKTLTST
jgi:HK97 family phage major capsid protein